MPRVLYLRAELLPWSETFVAAQARALRRYTAGFAGLKTLPGSAALPAPVVSVLDAGSLAGRGTRWAYQRADAQGLFALLSRSAVQACAHRIADWQPDLLHAHFATDAAAFLPIVDGVEHRLHRKLPLLVTLHGYDVGSSDASHAQTALGRLFLARRTALWQRATAFLCVSEALRTVAVERGFPAEKLVVHYTGVALLPQALPEPVRAEAEVLFVGRLVEKKGCNTLLEAMALVAACWSQGSRSAPRLTVLGDGPLRAALEDKARLLRLHAPSLEVHFAGAQPPEVVAAAMRRASVLVVPSRRAASGDCEGLPTVIPEAMAAGLPVVATRGSGAEEAILETYFDEHLETHFEEPLEEPSGWLVEAGNPSALALCIEQVLNDPVCAARRTAAARQAVVAQFDLARQTERLEGFYDLCCGIPPAAQGFPLPV